MVSAMTHGFRLSPTVRTEANVEELAFGTRTTILGGLGKGHPAAACDGSQVGL